MARPPKLRKRWSEVEVAPDVTEAMSAVQRLLDLQFDTGLTPATQPRSSSG